MKRTSVLIVGLLLLVVFRGPLLGCEGPVEATECVRADGASVCVDRRGSELEVRATGLFAESSVWFGDDVIPVGADGTFEGRYFFKTNANTLIGAIVIEATSATGAKLAGTVELVGSGGIGLE